MHRTSDELSDIFLGGKRLLLFRPCNFWCLQTKAPSALDPVTEQDEAEEPQQEDATPPPSLPPSSASCAETSE